MQRTAAELEEQRSRSDGLLGSFCFWVGLYVLALAAVLVVF